MTSLHGGTAPLASLTTVFTPPCSTTWLLTTTKVPSQFPDFPSGGPATCDPPAWASNLDGQGFDYYSPAICPDGFQVGQGCSIVSETRTAQGFPAVDVGETVAWCVPSGHSCTSDTTDFRGGIWGVSRTATATDAVVTVGPAMQIRWRDIDLAILATHPLTPGMVLAGTATSTTDRQPATATQTPSQTTATQTTPTPTTTTSAGSDDDDDEDSDTSTETATATATATGFATATGQSTSSSSSSSSRTTPSSTTRSTTAAAITPSSETTEGNDTTTDAEPSTAEPSMAETSSGAPPVSVELQQKGGSSISRAMVVTAVMVSLVGATALGVLIFLFLVRRRRRRQRQQNGSEEGGDGSEQASTDTSSGSSMFTSVGLGAWVRRTPRAPQQPRALKTGGREWLRSAVGRGERTGQIGASIKRWRLEMHLPSSRSRAVTTPPSAAPRSRPASARRSMAPAPAATPDMAELPGDATIFRSELPGSIPEGRTPDQPPVLPQVYISRHKSNSSLSSAFSSLHKEPLVYDDQQSRPPPSPSPSVQRWSWVPSLSRMLRSSVRSKRTTGGSGSGSAGGDDTESVLYSSRPSTRGSHWTSRTDDDDGGSVVYGDSASASWDAFARAQGGQARLVTIARKAGAARPGLTLPGDGGGGGRRPQLSPALSSRTNSHRFSRLSDGTFGRLNSFISRDGSRDSSRSARVSRGTEP